MKDLPEPTAPERAASEALVEHILADIQTSGGFIDFSRFMELALYAPGLGYYTGPARALGLTRDFVTAPDLSALFGSCLANFCRPVLEELGTGILLETGAGSGSLAIALLSALADQGALPDRYLIHEASPVLRTLQQQTIASALPGLHPRVSWVDEIPEGIRGVVLANELLDAMPCARFIAQERRLRRLGVTASGRTFSWGIGEILAEAESRITEQCVDGYVSELPLIAEHWVREVGARLGAGALLVVDYGFPRREYYHPDRAGVR